MVTKQQLTEKTENDMDIRNTSRRLSSRPTPQLRTRPPAPPRPAPTLLATCLPYRTTVTTSMRTSTRLCFYRPVQEYSMTTTQTERKGRGERVRSTRALEGKEAAKPHQETPHTLLLHSPCQLILTRLPCQHGFENHERVGLDRMSTSVVRTCGATSKLVIYYSTDKR